MNEIPVKLKMKNSRAEGLYNPEERSVLVKKGAKVERTTTKSFESSGYRHKRQRLMDNGTISNFVFTKDYKFSSLSGAAAVIGGRQAAGPLEWRTLEGTKIADLELSGDSSIEIDTNQEKYNQLIHFIENIDDLNLLKGETEFNLFETLSIVNTEIRHSNVLAWLLNPLETHGLGDYFTSHFIREVYKKNKIFYEKKGLRPEDLLLWDFEDAEIYREHQNIDLLIMDKNHQFAMAIENKILSKEHGKQLKKYENIVQNLPGIKNTMLVYLTLDGYEASDSDSWVSFSYEDVYTLIESLDFTQTSIKVKSFIEDYKLILRRHLLTDDKLEALCRRIYLKHKRALDLIYEYRPDIISDINEKVRNIIDDLDVYKESHSIKSIFRFTQQGIDRINDAYRSVASGWLKDRSIMVHEIRISEKELKIATVIGPSDNNERDLLINHYYQAVNPNNTKKTSKYQTIKSERIMKYKSENEPEEIFNDLDKKLESKITKHVNEINQVFASYKFEGQ